MSPVAFFFYCYYYLIPCEGETRVCLACQFVPPVDISADGTVSVLKGIVDRLQDNNGAAYQRELVKWNRPIDSRGVDLVKVRGSETVRVHVDIRTRELSLKDAMQRDVCSAPLCRLHREADVMARLLSAAPSLVLEAVLVTVAGVGAATAPPALH
ncbi:unnamed protein product [Taenia asiatica]|uniref:Ubiquitin-like domain-containing protein n=1 Tax=Taenia asiatica TaxID=60517 RepID=A0A0R3VWW5_TAEAS|nr:unnamed protein product [Taenia asiatica]